MLNGGTTSIILSFQANYEGYKPPIVEFTPMEGELRTEQLPMHASSDLSKIRSYDEMIDKQVLVLYYPDVLKKFVHVDETRFNYFVAILFILPLNFYYDMYLQPFGIISNIRLFLRPILK
jgi:hypothetical protein